MKSKITVLCLFLSSLALTSQAQVYNKDTLNNQDTIKVDTPPSPKGGFRSFNQYLIKTLKYPKIARKLGVTGTVKVTFIISKEGKVKDVQVLEGIGVGCDQEALRVIKGSPDWTPGTSNGEPVEVDMVIPIVFNLPSSNLTYYKELLLIVDGKILGKIKDYKHYLDTLRNDMIDEVEVLKPRIAKKQYGEPGKYGAAIITLEK